ncbi:glutamate 5-kinase [Fontisphaera persica]|uniref:glutamate 5-kinase n=1 Tax=Fontisphaera persica TaxID=2974023 RepID=UPI0024BFD257|nr:glutamate 5-kinase [Fontisphaera persica]WCJ60215.1 glutamate 5-kinase [Fontisphaera persica]
MRSKVLQNITRIVVKLGTGILTNAARQPDPVQMEQLTRQVASLRKSGKEVVMVSSGAVGAGMGVLGFARRPTELADLQACAAVGQSRLMAAYEAFFAREGLAVAQVLLTHDDLEDRERHLNARNTLLALLRHPNIVPIINENDAVSVTELKFGDNDKLSALVATLLPADLLVILTSVDGVIENYGRPNARTLSIIENLDASLERMAGGTDSETAVGGMKTKIQAARIVVRSGIPLVIASGRKKNTLQNILQGLNEGTLFVPKPAKLAGRKRWIAFFHHPRGSLLVDDGAKKSLRENGRSLLPAGIARCEGDFQAGEVVRICDLDGTEFARGISRFPADQIRARQCGRTEVVHRDDMVIL